MPSLQPLVMAEHQIGMSYRDVSSDPNAPLTVEEFKLAFDRFWDVLTTDKQIAKILAKENKTLKAKIDNAISGTKFAVYKELFWDWKRIERPQYDP